MDQTKDKLLEKAWGIICNAGEGNWDEESRDWRDAAMLFREQYFTVLQNDIVNER